MVKACRGISDEEVKEKSVPKSMVRSWAPCMCRFRLTVSREEHGILAPVLCAAVGSKSVPCN